MTGPSFPTLMGAVPAIPPENAVIPPSDSSPDYQGWDLLVRRIQDQRSELDRLEKEIEVVKFSRDMMAKLA